MTNIVKTIATPPGATIKEQLDLRGITQKEFSQRMGMSEKHMSNLVNGRTELTSDVALRLESVLGIPARFWCNLEAIYREKLARVAAENEMEEDKAIVQQIPYAKMAAKGWVPQTRILTEKVGYLRRFFEVARLDLITSNSPCAIYRQVSATARDDYTLVAWTQKTRIDARSITTKQINLYELERKIPQIRTMTRKNPEEFCIELFELMASCGVAMVFLDHIGGSFLHGASFYDGNRIVVGLTVRGKDADKFWFSLMHELAHVLLGHIGIAERTKKQEEEADAYARDKLIPRDDYDEFIKGVINEDTICSFADRIDVAPGIVVGRLQKEGLIDYSWYNGLKTKYQIVK